MTCTRCDSTGFLNIEQLPQEMAEQIDAGNYDKVLEWIKATPSHDVQVCDCCGDGETWYGTPGEHYHSEDLRGQNGPYAYNGGLCECN